MNLLFKLTLGICLIMVLFCCNKPANEMVIRSTVFFSELPAVAIPTELDTIIEIKNWMAIGPFDFHPLLTDPIETFSRNDLKKYGITEGSIDDADIENLQRQGVDVFFINSLSPQIKLIKYVSESITNKCNFYLVARIHSDSDRNVMLITDGSYSYALWLNRDKLVEVKGKYNTNKAGDRFINVSIKAGDNILFAKVNRGTNERSWDLISTIASQQEAERIFRINYANDFVIDPLVNNSFEIYAGPYTSGLVKILDGKEQIVTVASFDSLNTNNKPFVVSDIKSLEDGFYKVILTVGSENLEEMIYKGDYRQFAKKIKASVNEMGDNSPHSKDLKVAMERVDFLNKKHSNPNSPSDIRFVNRNRVFWGYSLYKMLLKDIKTQLMTYQSQEDNAGIFIFHIGYKQQLKIPLVIIVPSALQGNSMIEDWYTSNLDQIETDNALADQYGFAIAWIYAEGRKYSAYKTEKEITAIINRLKTEYDIDEQRIFITGDCEGGRRTLLQLAATPDRYAACAVSSPITLSGGSDGIPINLLPKMSKIPILIRHGIDDDVSPIENSRKFYDEAKKLNMPVKYIEVQGSHICIAKDLHRFVFEFFSKEESKQK